MVVQRTEVKQSEDEAGAYTPSCVDDAPIRNTGNIGQNAYQNKLGTHFVKIKQVDDRKTVQR